MAKKNISYEYILGIGIPMGYTKKGNLPPRKAQESDQGKKSFSKNFRRSHVQLFGILLLAFIYVGLFQSQLTWLFISLGACLLIPIVLIRYSIYSVMDLPNNFLDEREIALSDLGFLQAYKLLFIALVILFGVGIGFQVSLDTRQVIVAAVSVLATMYTLPSAIIAWQDKS